MLTRVAWNLDPPASPSQKLGVKACRVLFNQHQETKLQSTQNYKEGAGELLRTTLRHI